MTWKNNIQADFEDICKEIGVKTFIVSGNQRSKAIVAKRWSVIGELNALGYTSSQIGYITNKDHTTILHALGRMG